MPRRDPRIDAVLEAWHELHICEPSEKARCRKRLNELVDDLRKETSFTREEVKDALWNQFVELKRVKRRESWPRLPK